MSPAKVRAIVATASGIIPVVASLNGVTAGGWMDHATEIADAGADAAFGIAADDRLADPGDDAPCAEVRVQALFGLDRQPMIGNAPLLLKLTSPAGRPIQSTSDLPAFWRGSWADVKKEMKGRYPKHRWPDEPWVEKPSLKTKNAFNRSEN